VRNTVIFEYTLAQAISDGVLVPIFEQRWKQLTGGKPLVATDAVSKAFSPAALIEIWNAYVDWRRNVMPTLPEEEQLFSTTMNDQKVWVIEDSQAFTILFPEDY
jgi:hypothetical protein